MPLVFTALTGEVHLSITVIHLEVKVGKSNNFFFLKQNLQLVMITYIR